MRDWLPEDSAQVFFYAKIRNPEDRTFPLIHEGKIGKNGIAGNKKLYFWKNFGLGDLTAFNSLCLISSDNRCWQVFLLFYCSLLWENWRGG